jgi:hypothetical protein
VKSKTSQQKLPPVSDQMKAWSAALAAEAAEWPRATVRSFFGFNALYRGDDIFGILPRTRSFGNGNLLAFRIDDAKDRIKARLEKDPHIQYRSKQYPLVYVRTRVRRRPSSGAGLARHSIRSSE